MAGFRDVVPHAILYDWYVATMVREIIVIFHTMRREYNNIRQIKSKVEERKKISLVGTTNKTNIVYVCRFLTFPYYAYFNIPNFVFL